MHGTIAATEAGSGSANPDRKGAVLGLSPSGFHEITFADWGPLADKRPIVCVHGLTRQGRDFDYLAKHLAAAGRRVICPDLPGRGRSAWLANPNDYGLPQYCADMNALVARLGVEEIDWVGTSLGGLIGIVIAGFSGSIVRKLVINDIGPYVSSTGLHRIGQYIGKMPAAFGTIEEAVAYFKVVLEPYGKLSEEHWWHLAEHSVQWDAPSQSFLMLCDPAIAKAFRSPWFQSLDLWHYWEAINIPMLVLRGAQSDLLTAELASDMRRRNRAASTFQFDECGHVPPLMASDQIETVKRFLLQS